MKLKKIKKNYLKLKIKFGISIIMKLILIISKSKYRASNLNNFFNNQKIGKYYLICFKGYLSIIGVMISRIFDINTISIDDSVDYNRKNLINFWLTGTIHKIPKKNKNSNNFVNMKSVFHNKDKIFQIYPIIKFKKNEIKYSRKLIYASSHEIRQRDISLKIWKIKKKSLLEKFNYLDKRYFWDDREFNIFNNQEKFFLYRDLKSYQRSKIVKKLHKIYKKSFCLYGENWNKLINSNFKNISVNQLKRKYSNNICLDLGSKCGSLTLYPRSIQIIENGGLLIQSRQSDSKKIFGSLEKYITFNCFEDLQKIINRLMKDNDYYSDLLEKQNNHFKNTLEKMELQLNEIF